MLIYYNHGRNSIWCLKMFPIFFLFPLHINKRHIWCSFLKWNANILLGSCIVLGFFIWLLFCVCFKHYFSAYKIILDQRFSRFAVSKVYRGSWKSFIFLVFKKSMSIHQECCMIIIYIENNQISQCFHTLVTLTFEISGKINQDWSYIHQIIQIVIFYTYF